MMTVMMRRRGWWWWWKKTGQNIFFSLSFFRLHLLSENLDSGCYVLKVMTFFSLSFLLITFHLDHVNDFEFGRTIFVGKTNYVHCVSFERHLKCSNRVSLIWLTREKNFFFFYSNFILLLSLGVGSNLIVNC